jgi:hypothetical protein
VVEEAVAEVAVEGACRLDRGGRVMMAPGSEAVLVGAVALEVAGRVRQSAVLLLQEEEEAAAAGAATPLQFKSRFPSSGGTSTFSPPLTWPTGRKRSCKQSVRSAQNC